MVEFNNKLLDKEGAEVTKDRTSRSTVVRIWTIYTLIKNRQYHDCRKLAAKLEVSPRTIERDLELLRDRMQAPLEFDRLRRGYYLSKDLLIRELEMKHYIGCY